MTLLPCNAPTRTSVKADGGHPTDRHRRVANLATSGRPRLVTTMPARSSLNVSLTQELTAFIAAQVASGRYRSASEVVRASLRLLQRDEFAFATGSDPTDRVGGGDGGP